MKITIDVAGLAEVIIDIVVWHHGLIDSIITDWGFLFTSKFWSSLCYFLEIKKILSTAFHPQVDGRTKRQYSTMEAYLWVFLNWEQNNWARLLLIAEFAYNNDKNAKLVTRFSNSTATSIHEFFSKTTLTLALVSLCHITGKRAKRTDGYLWTKLTPCPRTLEKSIWQRREASKLYSGRESLIE